MSLMDANGGLSAADVAAVMGNNGNGFNFGGDGGWLFLLIMFALFGNGNWGNNGGNNYQNDVQRGFDQSAIMSGINGVSNAVANGFANAEVSRCNAQTNVLQAMNNNQAATVAALNTVAGNLQNCCCENRAGLADLKYTVATENCADRTALQEATQNLLTAQTAGTQQIIDKLCQLEMDGIKQNYENRIAGMQNQIDTLRSQVATAADTASQNALASRILADNAAQTAALEQYLNPAPIPAYVVQNPNCCGPLYNNGCSVA